MVSRSTLSEANESVVDNGDGTYSRVVTTGSGTSAGQIQGNVGSGAADGTSNPVKMGLRYNTTKPTVTDGQRVDAQSNAFGIMQVGIRGAGLSGLEVETGQLNTDTNNAAAVSVKAQAHGYVYDAPGTNWTRQSGNTVATSVLQGLTGTWWNYAAANLGIVNTTTAVTVKTAAGASVRNYIRQLELEWETLGAATEFAIRDGAAGAVLYRTKLPTVAGRKTVALQLRGTANTLLEVVTLTASVTGAVYANLDGYTGA